MSKVKLNNPKFNLYVNLGGYGGYQIVTKNKIGLSLKSEDLSNFNFLIKNANIKELKKNVRKFNIRNSLDKKGKDLLSFFESL